MKKVILLFTLLAFIGTTATLMAQNKKKGMQDANYRRSSLHTILVGTGDFPSKKMVLKAYSEAPFPDKYNQHDIAVKSFVLSDYPILEADHIALEAGKSEASKQFGKFGKSVASETTGGIVDSNEVFMPMRLARFIEDKKVANQLVATWFDRQNDGTFDMELIGERGFYNASEMQASIAKGSARGTASIADAGEELIGNTFVVFHKMKFVSNEPIARVIRDAGYAVADSLGNQMLVDKAREKVDAVYNKTKEGYSVWTNSYLFQLVWNDSVANVFYNDLWVDKSNIDPKRKEAFDNSELFKLKYIGKQKATSLVTFSLKEDRTEQQIIDLATVRNIDKVYAKLQKKYDVFKVKTPLYTGYPITAQIGKKEGLEGGEKFEVLEQSVDPKTGLTVYKSKGKIKVSKDVIWDNRYNAGDETAEIQKDSEGNVIEATLFEGGKKFYPGMLIRELK
jgi:hypothetical protein